MAKTWVLDTETKGTGAEMVPLERAQKQKRSSRGISLGRRRAAARSRQAPESTPTPRRRRPQPRQFKLISAISCRVLAEDVGVRDAIDLLGQVRSLVDVRVYARDAESEEWRPLTLAETRILRGRPGG